ncbi:MAG: ribosome biogenesis GTPase Der [Acidobacteriota bacterium]|nr:ribosome biogenesis GTPase Der [Acidobacteriota bacterium]
MSFASVPVVESAARERPAVAIVGRPNVGKSTLFNRLVGQRRAIVHDLPGVTRDRIVASAELAEVRTVDLIDTGGLLPDKDDSIGLNEQVLLAIDESDVLVLVVDGRAGPVPGDHEVVEVIRRYAKPIVLAVNKADTRDADLHVHEFYSLGFEPLLISAEHGIGMETLSEAVVEVLPEASESPLAKGVPIAIVGRPNVGKSSLLNRLLGDNRALVSPMAGTTRDPIDSVVSWEGRSFVLVDTAGIRRRSRVSGAAEDLAVMMARRQLERAKVGLVVIDAADGITSGDLAIAATSWELGRATVIVANKWDLVDEAAREKVEDGFARLGELLADPPRVNVSALTGRRVDRLFPAIAEILEDYSLQVETSRLNEILQRAVAAHHMPTVSGKPWKLLYASQVGAQPPTFMFFANRVLPQKSTLRRYLENSLRRELGLPGVPIRLVIRRPKKLGLRAASLAREQPADPAEESE